MRATPRAGPRAAIEAFVRVILAQPAAARMCFVESYAAGEEGMRPVRRRSTGSSCSPAKPPRDAGRAGMPPELLQGIVGGLYQVIYKRLLERREKELPGLPAALGLGDELPAAAAAAAPTGPPGRHAARSRPRRRSPPSAPNSGSSAASPGRSRARATRRRRSPTSPPPPRSRRRPSTSTSTASPTCSARRSTRAVPSCSPRCSPRSAARQDWRTAMRVGFEEICGFLASEPAFASMRCVDAYAAGSGGDRHPRAHGVQIITELVRPRLRGPRRLPPRSRTSAPPARSTRSSSRASAVAAPATSPASPRSSPTSPWCPSIGCRGGLRVDQRPRSRSDAWRQVPGVFGTSRSGAFAGAQVGFSGPVTFQTVTAPSSKSGSTPPEPLQPAGLGRGDRLAGVEEVEEGRGDQVVEVGVVDGGAECFAGGDRVVGAVRAGFAEVDDVVGEVGAVEAVAGEARRSSRRGRSASRVMPRAQR